MAHKLGNLEHTAQPEGSLTGWRMSFRQVRYLNLFWVTWLPLAAFKRLSMSECVSQESYNLYILGEGGAW